MPTPDRYSLDTATESTAEQRAWWVLFMLSGAAGALGIMGLLMSWHINMRNGGMVLQAHRDAAGVDVTLFVDGHQPALWAAQALIVCPGGTPRQVALPRVLVRPGHLRHVFWPTAPWRDCDVTLTGHFGSTPVAVYAGAVPTPTP